MTALIGIVLLLIIGAIISVFDRPPTKLTDVHNGYDYERYCAGKLQETGWRCTVTVASGDQGVDVIATKQGLKAAIQCKFYTKAVGNKAVQEVIAGAVYSGASVAVVIASSRYTESAEELARAANVLLITHDDIPKLDRLLASGAGNLRMNYRRKITFRNFAP